MKYNFRDVPRNKILWACGYETNNTEKGMRFKKEPVRGLIKGNNSFWDSYFYEVNKKDEPIVSKRVKTTARHYADTQEECIEIYNEQVMKQVDLLKNLIKECEDDLIK